MTRPLLSLRHFSRLTTAVRYCLVNSSVLRARHFSSADIQVNKEAISVPSLAASFPYVWLRDSCQCSSCVHPSTRQKLHRSSDIPLDVKPVSAEDSVRTVESPDGIEVKWDATDHEMHISFYSLDFLKRHSTSTNLDAFHKDVAAEPWTSAGYAKLARDDLFVPYADLSNTDTLLSIYTRLVRHGLVFLRDVPNIHTSDKECELRVLATTLGEIRKTFYGETWDVRSVRNSKNIAYTNLDLGLHMDLLYFKEPPRYQMLHCLRNRVNGGHSTFVDGLQAALQLYKTSLEDFLILASTQVNFHYINDGHHLHCSHPTFELEKFGSAQSPHVILNGDAYKITSINYSPPFQAPLSVTTSPAFYNSLAKYAALLDNPNNSFMILLREGDVVVFDNRRVLHGRTAFTDSDQNINEDQTNRWLKGCYLEEDPVLDRMRILRASL